MNPTLYLVIGLALGGLAGFLAGWLAGRNRAAPPDTRLENELREQLRQRETGLEQLRGQVTEAGNALAAAQARETAAAQRSQEQQALATQLGSEAETAKKQLLDARTQMATAGAQLEAERQSLAQLRKDRDETGLALQTSSAEALALREQNGALTEKMRFLEERLAQERQQIETIQQRFQKEFEAVAHKLLVDNSSRFGQQSAENLDKLLGPLRENLKDFRARLDSVHKENAEHSALLKEQISRIGTEAANLAKALKGDVKVLGNWGENMLDQILDKSGLQFGIHYRRQGGFTDEAGDQRFLDVIIELPENRHLVIDSKVSLKAYEDAMNCADDETRRGHLENHVARIRSHFRQLGAKRYQDLYKITAPDFVLMYIPIEGAFFAAVGHEPGLFSEALDRNVVMISNSSLLATLRTVAHVWRLADQQKHALDIAERGGKLYDKFVGFITDLQKVGEALDQGHAAWEEANKKLHLGPGNLVRQAEQLRELGVKATKSLPAEVTALADGDEAGSPPPPPPTPLLPESPESTPAAGQGS